jgi:hypothetical protein
MYVCIEVKEKGIIWVNASVITIAELQKLSKSNVINILDYKIIRK